MKISTFSIVVGSRSCDAACPFCISHVTGFEQLRNDDIDWQAFSAAVSLARQANTTTLLLTGKGEPCLYTDEITLYLRALYALGEERNVPTDYISRLAHPIVVHKPVISLIELQTNGIRIGQLAAKIALGSKPVKDYVDYEWQQRELLGFTTAESKFLDALVEWRQLGLRTIALSTVGTSSRWNKQIYLHHREIEYPDLAVTVKFLHDLGFNVRLCVMMHAKMVDSPESVDATIAWCKQHHVDQLTVRPIRRPQGEVANDYERYVDTYGLDQEQERAVFDHLRARGQLIHTIMMGDHPSPVYDIDGQNVCMADCLTVSSEPDTIRTLILYPHSGEIAYHWQYAGAKL